MSQKTTGYPSIDKPWLKYYSEEAIEAPLPEGIGYMDENGCLFIVDRIKRMIIRFDGFKVFPSQVEQVLSANGSVNDCCVVGRPDHSQSHGMLPVAFVRLEDGASEQAVKRELISACETELPEYAQPSGFVFVKELPLTPIGKVDYRKLEELAAEME